MSENSPEGRQPVGFGISGESHDEEEARWGGETLSLVLLAVLVGAVFFLYQLEEGSLGYESAKLLQAGTNDPGAASGSAFGSAQGDARAQEAMLSIQSSPSEADVLIGGKLIGRTPIQDHALPTDAYVVTLRKSGYRLADSVIFVQPGEKHSLRIRLQSRSRPEQRERPVSKPERDRSDRSSDSGLSNSGSNTSGSDTDGSSSRSEASYRPSEPVPPRRAPEESAAAGYDRHMAEGNELLIQERYVDARRAYERALEAQPSSEKATVRLERANALIEEEARAQRLFSYHEGKGDVHLENGNYEAAIESYETALQHAPGEPRVQERLAQSSEALRSAAQQEEAEQRAKQQPTLLPSGAYLVVDQRPRLVGGMEALHRKLRYPERAARRGIEGRVTVQMIVDEEGRVRDPVVLKGIGGGCDEEALRAVRQARFEPARINGTPVPAQHALWVQFKLER